MVTPTIFYQQMKKWVGSDNDRPVLQHIFFDSDSGRAYATDARRMALVKDFPSQDKHFETVQGARNDDIPPFSAIDYDRVLVTEDRQGWRKDIQFTIRQSKDFLNDWKNAVSALSKIAKSTAYNMVILQKRGPRLYAYAVNSTVSMKVILLDNMEGTEAENDWEAGFNARYLEYVMEFLKATEPMELSIYTSRHKLPVLTFETEDLILLITCIRILKSNHEALMNFVNSESLRVEENTEDEATGTEE